MEVAVLASGSSANVVFVSDGRTSLLVDCGLSARKLTERMEQIGRRPNDLEAILVTHEHSDHIGGLGPVSRRYKTPVFAARSVRERCLGKQGDLKDVRSFEPGRGFDVGSLRIQPFCVPHDATEPVCFVISAGNSRIGIVTDLGHTTHLVRQKLAGCQVAILEFNHDPELLMESSYPWQVKQRILSRHGHLSNEAAGCLLGQLAADTRLERVILAHLSERNNHPDLALDRAAQAIGQRTGIDLVVARQNRPTPLFELRPSEPEPLSLFAV